MSEPEAAIVNGALVFTEFNNEQIRKVALDMCDIARQIRRESAEGDETMRDLAFRLTSVSVLLISYFPAPSAHFEDFQEHTSNGC